MTEPNSEFHRGVRRYGTQLVHLIEDLGLSIILLATIFAGGFEVHHMWEQRQVMLEDLLLLFIYVETVTMVKVYWESGKLPVRMPLYIAIVAIARYLIIDIKDMDGTRALSISSSILIVSLAVLVVRWAHVKLPYPSSARENESVE